MNTKNLRQVSTYIKPELINEFKKKAKEEERSMSFILKKLIEKYLKEEIK
ncbi:MAG TPA: hypothetical protein VMV95_03055 [Bacillota bacterium]|nr:hypothetical protein [Bacillota bacterium]